ncbi:MAG TPA: ribonuclease P protein component [Flavobacteriaceae bacterium]|nr:ribonuclease P protein component [Flavobacteriaceae bacterium]
MQFGYNKYEKLKSRKLIKQLFEDGKAISVFPLRLVYLKTNHDGKYLLQTGVSVSKRNFKLAVDRNRIKRMMREVYRLNKAKFYNSISEKYIFMFIYLGKKEMDYHKLDKKMNELIDSFLNKNS